jgi:hypothetical protein
MSLDMISDAFLWAAIIALSVVLLVYWLLKSHKIEDVITNSIENVIRDVSEDVELQKKLYQLGGIMGNGVKAGVGLTTKGGKFKFEDLAMGLLSKYLVGNQEQPINSEKTLL